MGKIRRKILSVVSVALCFAVLTLSVGCSMLFNNAVNDDETAISNITDSGYADSYIEQKLDNEEFGLDNTDKDFVGDDITIPDSGNSIETGESTQPEEVTEPADTTQTTTTEIDRASAFLDGAFVSGETGTKIVLSGETATIIGGGAKVSGKVVSITSTGIYAVTGTATDMQILVNCDSSSANFNLRLANANITCSNSAPICMIGKGSKILSVIGGTTNTLTDGSSYNAAGGVAYSVDTDGTGETPNATLFCKNDLTINNSGTLIVNGNYNNGIGSKDTLKFLGSVKTTVISKNNALKGNDAVSVQGGTFNITSSSDAIKSDCETEGLGNIYIGEDNTNGSTINMTIKAANDGLQSYSCTAITSGIIDITSANGSTGSHYSGTASAKGIKSSLSVAISGGDITINSKDDAIHSNDEVVISKGTITLSTDDDGVHADEIVQIGGGIVTVARSYEGVEGNAISFTGGTVSIISSDDGINAANPSVTSAEIGGPQQGRPHGGGQIESAGTSTCNFGGSCFVKVISSGDGLDANGNLTMSGGTVIVECVGNGNGILDYDGSFVLTGGTFLATGTTSMAQYPNSASSSQYFITTTSSYNVGTVLNFQTTSGTQLFNYTTTKSGSLIIFSCPTMTAGTYLLYKNNSAQGIQLTAVQSKSGSQW